MDRKIVIVLLVVPFIFIMSGCSHYSKNVVKKGSFTLQSGKSGEESWDDQLEFMRTSWYNELTMIADLLVTDLDPQSPFYRWATSKDGEVISSCPQMKVVLAYILDSKKVSHSEIKAEWEKNGFEEIVLNQFSKNLRAHPDFFPQGFNPYKVYGLCRKGPIAPIEITLPGYSAQTL